MKKVILTLVFAVFTAFAFAQDYDQDHYCPEEGHCDEINQRRDSCEPRISDPDICEDSSVVFNRTASHSTIIQTGKNSDADVTQSGNNLAYINQNGTGEARNSATVDQDSDLIFGGFNEAYTFQNGKGNTSTITQSDIRNKADVYQEGDGNSSTVTQEFKGRNKADIDQWGDRNSAVLTQKGGSYYYFYADNKAKILQCGYENADRSMQDGLRQKICVTQVGNNNRVGQDQFGKRNLMVVEQGDHLRPDTKASYFSTADQYQDGNRNKAYASQFATDNKVIQTQMGNDNYLEAIQNNKGADEPRAGNNTADQYQDGKRNEALAQQWGKNNFVKQEQFGDDNIAIARQRFGQKAGNTSIQTQNGEDLFSATWQKAHGNLSTVDQSGKSHVSYVRQNWVSPGGGAGGFNTATVTQMDK